MKGLRLFSGSKKGQAMAIPGPVMAGIAAVFGLFLIGVFIFAFAIAGSEMADAAGDSACSAYWNTSVKQCQVSASNSTLVAYNDTAVSVINETVQGASSFASFSPTLWIITAIGILIGLLLVFVGGFFLLRR